MCEKRSCGFAARARGCARRDGADTIEPDSPEEAYVTRALVVLLLLALPAPVLAEKDSSSHRQVDFGLTVAQKGLWQEARFRFERAVAIDPQNAAALNDLAVALEQMGEFDKARQCYEKALKLKPNDLYIQQNFDLFREADDKRNRKSRRKK
jgi:Tfp pilus assembly protein PilF